MSYHHSPRADGGDLTASLIEVDRVVLRSRAICEANKGEANKGEANKGDVLNCYGTMRSLREARLPRSFNLPKPLRMSPSPTRNRNQS